MNDQTYRDHCNDHLTSHREKENLFHQCEYLSFDYYNSVSYFVLYFISFYTISPDRPIVNPTIGDYSNDFLLFVSYSTEPKIRNSFSFLRYTISRTNSL